MRNIVAISFVTFWLLGVKTEQMKRVKYMIKLLQGFMQGRDNLNDVVDYKTTQSMQ